MQLQLCAISWRFGSQSGGCEVEPPLWSRLEEKDCFMTPPDAHSSLFQYCPSLNGAGVLDSRKKCNFVKFLDHVRARTWLFFGRIWDFKSSSNFSVSTFIIQHALYIYSFVHKLSQIIPQRQLKCCMVQYEKKQYDTVWYYLIQYYSIKKMILYDMVQYGTVS